MGRIWCAEHSEPHTPQLEPDFICNFYSVCDNNRFCYSSDFRFQISKLANLPRSGNSAFYWHLTPWPPLLDSLSRAKAREEGEKGAGKWTMNNEQCRMDNHPRSGNTPWPPLLDSLSRAKAREEGEKGAGKWTMNNEQCRMDNHPRSGSIRRGGGLRG